MEGKNLILAISLSALVLIMWSIFFAPPPSTIDKKQNKIEQIIFVAKKSQRAILIGKGGSKIKQIGTRARHEIEKLLKQKIFLDLYDKGLVYRKQSYVNWKAWSRSRNAIFGRWRSNCQL